jgi:hypothetical protein
MCLIKGLTYKSGAQEYRAYFKATRVPRVVAFGYIRLKIYQGAISSISFVTRGLHDVDELDEMVRQQFGAPTFEYPKSAKDYKDYGSLARAALLSRSSIFLMYKSGTPTTLLSCFFSKKTPESGYFEIESYEQKQRDQQETKQLGEVVKRMKSRNAR